MNMKLEWQPRDTALEAAGAVAQGKVGRRLLARLRAQAEDTLVGLSVVATRDMLMVLGRSEQLPWVDGVRYCAPEPAAPSLWLPTVVAPTLSPDLLQAALANRLKRAPLLLWNEPEQILPLDCPLALSMSLLEWLIKEFD